MESVSATLTLENQVLRLEFDPQRGRLNALHNKLTGEIYCLQDEMFYVETESFRLALDDMRLAACARRGAAVVAQYVDDRLSVQVEYTLKGGNHFAEKRLTLLPAQPCGVRKIVVSRALFIVPELRALVSYRYQQNITFFGRTPLGGFLAGLEIPFDTSLAEDNELTLSYRPNLKVPGGTALAAEPAYLGIYRRAAHEPEVDGELLGGYQYQHCPLPSESDAMLAMVATILGPPRHDPIAVISPSCCGGLNCFQQEKTWRKDKEAAATYRKIYDFAAECGIGWAQDILPWGGETAKMNALTAGQAYHPAPWLAELHDYARQKGITPIMWNALNSTEPWSSDGRPFRPDCPEWYIEPVEEKHPTYKHDLWSAGLWKCWGNCYGAMEFVAWVTQLFLKSMAAGGYSGFSLDGDFWGTGGWYTQTSLGVRCQSKQHEHLAGDAQYACERGLARMLADIRRQYPKAFLWLMRPFMDLGIWTYRHGDAVFPMDECGQVTNMTRIPDQPTNVTFGDKIRFWSRIRRRRHFCPHYLDQVQLFATMDGGGGGGPWVSAKLDYVMLSTIASTPNQCYFCGPVDDIPSPDRAIIRRWLDWSRKNAGYLMVCKDLPAWPGKDIVDGIAHVVGDRGYIFLFNPNGETRAATFVLNEQCIGLQGEGDYVITQEYPENNTASGRTFCGATVDWKVPAFTAMVLRIEPATGTRGQKRPRIILSVPSTSSRPPSAPTGAISRLPP